MIYILIEYQTLKKYSAPAIAQHIPEGSRVVLYGIGKPTDLSLVPFRELTVLRCEGIFSFGEWDLICNGKGIKSACYAREFRGSIFYCHESDLADDDRGQIVVIDDGIDYAERMPLSLIDALRYCRRQYHCKHQHQSMQVFLTSNKQRSETNEGTHSTI